MGSFDRIETVYRVDGKIHESRESAENAIRITDKVFFDVVVFLQSKEARSKTESTEIAQALFDLLMSVKRQPLC